METVLPVCKFGRTGTVQKDLHVGSKKAGTPPPWRIWRWTRAFWRKYCSEHELRTAKVHRQMAVDLAVGFGGGAGVCVGSAYGQKTYGPPSGLSSSPPNGGGFGGGFWRWGLGFCRKCLRANDLRTAKWVVKFTAKWRWSWRWVLAVELAVPFVTQH
jgi:hypothetical protein